MILTGNQGWKPVSGGKSMVFGAKVNCIINSCVSLGNSLYLSKYPFPHLKNGHNGIKTKLMSRLKMNAVI